MTDLINTLLKWVQEEEINYCDRIAVISVNLVIINCQSSILLKKHNRY